MLPWESHEIVYGADHLQVEGAVGATSANGTSNGWNAAQPKSQHRVSLDSKILKTAEGLEKIKHISVVERAS